MTGCEKIQHGVIFKNIEMQCSLKSLKSDVTCDIEKRVKYLFGLVESSILGQRTLQTCMEDSYFTTYMFKAFNFWRGI